MRKGLVMCLILLTLILVILGNYSYASNTTNVKVITDINGWKHDTKKILAPSPFNIYKLELVNNTYPKFYVKYPDKKALDNKEKIKDLAGKIAMANGFWDYELINAGANITVKVSCDKKLKKVIKILVNGKIYFEEQQNNKVGVPKIFTDYIKNKGENTNNDKIAFYVSEDIDLDGKKESIIATGTMNGDPSASYISCLYILREKNGKIEQVGGNLAQGGYGTYDVKLIRMQGKPGKYIWCGVTNGANLIGFKVYSLSNNKVALACSSASATGAGEDTLRDFNNDGQYDGYIQHRWSYDVLWFEMVRTYSLKNNSFVISSTHVDIPEYPSNIKDVVMQYLSLRVIDADDSPEVQKRLSELCKASKASPKEFAADIWYYPLYSTAMGVGEQLDFKINQKTASADVTISFTSEDNKFYKCSFHMLKNNNKWYIDKIN